MISASKRSTTGFALTVPESWFEIELRPAFRDDAIRALVYERTQQQPELREHRATIVRILREFAERAWESGALYCGCFVQPTLEGPITGSVTVTIIDAPPGDTASDRVTAVLDALAPAGSVAVKQTPNLTIAMLPAAGEAARSYGQETVELADGQSLRTIAMQTFVPIPESSGLALISASSPVLWMDEELLDLFDAVTGTFTFV